MKKHNFTKEQINKMKKGAVSFAFAGAIGLAGVSAYFTDTDTATNTFTVGKVQQELTEPKWNPPTNITPGGEFDKDPTITNTGVNDQYVFATVTVPYANIITANDDGTRKAAADTELFSYTVNAGWTQLGEPAKDTTHNTVTYTYYYGTGNTLTSLAKAAKTPAIFNKIKFVNAVEGQGLEEQTENVVVNSYGIQTTNLGSATTPAQVYQLIQNQNK